MLLFLNGTGEKGIDGVNQISNNFGLQVWEMQEFLPFLAVCPQCREGGSWSAGSLDTQWALEILDAVIEEFHGDPERVFLTGVSSGGSGVWAVGSAYANRFAGLVPLCASGGYSVRQFMDARMPIWMFCNDGDSPGLVQSLQRDRAKLIRAGLSPLLTMYPDVGHDCWNAAYRSTALYEWLLEQSREENAQEPLFEYLPPPRLVAEWGRAGGGEWWVEDDGVLVGRGEGRESLLQAAGASSGFEVHGEVWLPSDAVRDVALAGASAETAEPQFRFSITLPEQGSGGIVRSTDGEWLAVLDMAAQHWLKAEAWTDVRLKWQNGRLAVRLNGWRAADVELGGGDPEFASYRMALVAPADGSEVRWRNIRTRTLGEPPLGESEGGP